MRTFLLGFLALLASDTVAALHAAPCSRRVALSTGFTAAMLPAFASARVDEMDELQAAAKRLDEALGNWETEIRMVKLSRPGRLNAAIESLSDASLKALAQDEKAAKAASEYKKHKNSMLTFLFLANGASKYETADVVAKYMGSAKAEAQLIRDSLADMAGVRGVELQTSSLSTSE
mmetsp:Transcript_18943/g.40884  ORF Transcript_18943/g.40884 Transcript_18943/m.40884 type:complete len:176 (+) Transcript_18943:290-817(+)